MRSLYIVPIAIIIGGFIIAAAVYFSLAGSGANAGADLSLITPVSASDHILGNPAAPIQIIEYSDFDCTYCRGFSGTMHQIVANDGAEGSVAWVYREFPLTELHPNAFAHARAAECAALVGGNDAFWKFAGALYANQPVDPSRYGSLASTTGLDGAAFARCYANASSTVDARIRADRANAFAIGANGTPFSVILSKRAPVVMNGAYSYDAIKQLLDQVSTR